MFRKSIIIDIFQTRTASKIANVFTSDNEDTISKFLKSKYFQCFLAWLYFLYFHILHQWRKCVLNYYTIRNIFSVQIFSWPKLEEGVSKMWYSDTLSFGICVSRWTAHRRQLCALNMESLVTQREWTLKALKLTKP